MTENVLDVFHTMSHIAVEKWIALSSTSMHFLLDRWFGSVQHCFIALYKLYRQLPPFLHRKHYTMLSVYVGMVLVVMIHAVNAVNTVIEAISQCKQMGICTHYPV